MIKLRRLRCSFCGRNENEVLKLVAGRRVYICDECVAIASRMMKSGSRDDSQSPKVEPTVWSKLLARIRQLLHGDDVQCVSSLSRSD